MCPAQASQAASKNSSCRRLNLRESAGHLPCGHHTQKPIIKAMSTVPWAHKDTAEKGDPKQIISNNIEVAFSRDFSSPIPKMEVEKYKKMSHYYQA